MEEVFSGIFVFTVSVILLWTGNFYLNKRRYKDPDDGMEYLLKFTPLPQIINYWLVKILFIIAGLLGIFSCIYVMIQNISY
ncbi:hypothetical protein M3589_16545 [Heyndrickxia oleronia]|uniref:hypothetical protein n=1 Tax=Heyndrickxia oleronia TaxID=38875 RepID=UPI00203DD7AD|nr:hypothetical protein [Heyndrickxia oleronia]MCM3239314.1 hypothetical protein [Heyndrickxia oleronia]